MPLVFIEVDEGKTLEQKRGAIKDVTEAICKNFKVDPQSVSVHFREGKKENRGRGGKLAID